MFTVKIVLKSGKVIVESMIEKKIMAFINQFEGIEAWIITQ